MFFQFETPSNLEPCAGHASGRVIFPANGSLPKVLGHRTAAGREVRVRVVEKYDATACVCQAAGVGGVAAGEAGAVGVQPGPDRSEDGEGMGADATGVAGGAA